MTTVPINPDAILSVDHLTMRFGGLVAIGDVSFQAKRGEITALIGPNGAGKTTVFNCITGFYKPTEGMLTLNLRDGQTFLLERLPGHEINARAKVARTFQNIRLFSGMTVLENLLVAQHNKLMKASGYTVLGLIGVGGYRAAAAESIELAKFWLDKAQLTHRADEPAGSLPYGDQRRLEIARAMCTGPELLCLDEPAAGLNPKESLALNTLLIDIKNSTNTSILLIEHDMSVVMQISDHVVVLEYGRKISDGDPTFVKADPRVIAAYLGVEDEEVETVLVEVGDEDVIESLDAEPDRQHGPGDSASMMAGPISDTVGHSDPTGETVRVEHGASRAEQVDRRAARLASLPETPPPVPVPPAVEPSTKTAARAPKPRAAKPAAAAPSTSVKSTAPKPRPVAAPKPTEKPAEAAEKPAAAKPPAKPGTAAKTAATAKSTVAEKPVTTAKPTPARQATYGLARTVKPAAAPKPGVATAPKAPAKAPATAKAPAAPKAPVKTAATAKAPAAAAPKAPAKVPAAAKPAASKPVAAKAPATPAAKALATATPPASRAKPTVAAKPPASPKKPRRTSNWLAAPRGGRADDLLKIKGIGPINKRKLNEHGIFHFDQIAAWTRADIEAAEAYLEFDGRIDREDWIGQARTLDSQQDKASSRRGGK